MYSLRSILLAGAAISLVGATAVAAETRPLVLAQAATPAPVPEAVAAAKAKVDAARAALRDATASGKGVREAAVVLAAAIKELDAARAAAGLPPSGETVDSAGAQPPAGQPPVAGQPPAGAPPAGQATTGHPPAGQGAPAATDTLDPSKQKKIVVPQVVPPGDTKAPAADAKGTIQPPIVPPAGQAVVPPAAGQAIVPPGGQPPAGQAINPPAAGQAGQPAAGQATGQPVFVPGQPIDPSKFGKDRPRFGENQPADKTVALPQTEAAIKEGQTVQAPDGRVIVKEDGQVTVKHDDDQRFRREGFQVDTRTGADGTTTTTVTGPGGTQIVTIKDRDGNILQRYRKNPNGSIEVLIGAVEPQPRGGFTAPPPPPKPLPPQRSFNFSVQLPQLVVKIPQQDYIVESSRASEAQLQQTFRAPPVEQVERPYSLEEIRRSARLRDKVRRVDFDTVTFEFGSAVLPDDQIPKMQSVGEAIRNVLAADPSQVFLIEGHTDAVGSDIANLALSDRRAETVAEILSYYFGVPAENMVTQGYGEQFLKIPTTAAERENRRVAFRNITPLLRVGSR